MGKKTLDQYYESYAKEVYAYIFSLCQNHTVAEEIVQETFYRAFLNLDELTDERIKPWLFRVAYNAFVDYKRKEKRQLPQEPEFFEQKLQEPSFEQRVMNNEKIKNLFSQIDQLPFKQKQALLLSTIHHLTYEEIASILNVSEANVRLLVFRARSTLRKKEKGES